MAADISGIDALFNQAASDSFNCQTCDKRVAFPKVGRRPEPPFCRECKERARYRKKAKPTPNCIQCEQPLAQDTHGLTKWCPECKPAAKREYARLLARAHFVPAPEPEQKACLNCEVTFIPISNHAHIRYCSEECRRSVQWAQRNAQRKLAGNPHKIERVSVYRVLSRDGWRCQFCKVKTPRELRGTTKPNAPEIDHIMPLSLGGSHEESNLQCLCRACNMAKGARPMGQHRLL